MKHDLETLFGMDKTRYTQMVATIIQAMVSAPASKVVNGHDYVNGGDFIEELLKKMEETPGITLKEMFAAGFMVNELMASYDKAMAALTARQVQNN
jgi:hypothetical protein